MVLSKLIFEIALSILPSNSFKSLNALVSSMGKAKIFTQKENSRKTEIFLSILLQFSVEDNGRLLE